MSSVASVVNEAAARLRDAGFSPDEARRDAVVLARGVCGWSPADWLAHSVDEASEGFRRAFGALVARRQTREPVAYLAGEREFYGRPFRVTPDTLIPRPETEGLVDAALAWLHRHAAAAAPRVVDVGTGTGCVGITLALERPDPPGVTMVATDISSGALAVARENAVRLGALHIDFQLGSLLANAETPLDLVVSNPPYVPAGNRHDLQPDVVLFEPHEALFAGRDGLDVIRRLIPEARRALRPGGALMMEIGAGQADSVGTLLETGGFAPVERHADLQGISRIIVAHTPASSL